MVWLLLSPGWSKIEAGHLKKIPRRSGGESQSDSTALADMAGHVLFVGHCGPFEAPARLA